jgi:hypothetical protein
MRYDERLKMKARMTHPDATKVGKLGVFKKSAMRMEQRKRGTTGFTCVNIHFDNAVTNSRLNLLLCRARTTMEHKVPCRTLSAKVTKKPTKPTEVAPVRPTSGTQISDAGPTKRVAASHYQAYKRRGRFQTQLQC